MEAINNLATQTDYVDSLTLGPSNYEALSVSVWNASCVMQPFAFSSSGEFQTGSSGTEILVAPQSLVLGRCGGVRFRSNPASPSTPARIVAYAWKDGEPQITGGVQNIGTLAASGSVAPPGGGGMQLISNIDLTVNQTFSGFPIDGTFKHLRVYGQVRSTVASATDPIGMALNFDGSASYTWQFNAAAGATVSGQDGGGSTTNIRVGRMPGGTSLANKFGSLVVDIPYYAVTTVFKSGTAQSAAPFSNGAAGLAIEENAFEYDSLSAIAAITLQSSLAFAAGSQASLYGVA